MFMGIHMGLGAMYGGGGGSPSDSYALNEVSPKYVIDFNNNFARVDGSTSTLADAVTYSGGGLRTCYNSDGNLCWNAHNFLRNSDNLLGDSWSTSGNATVTGASTFNFSVTGDGARLQTDITTGAQLSTYVLAFDYTANGTFSVRLRDGSSSVILDGQTSRQVGSAATTTSIVMSSQEYSFPSGATLWFRSDSGNTASNITITNLRFYRADLPMLDNPDTGTSYVPTTSAAVYKWRANGYLYEDGTLSRPKLIWDSAAATNLNPNSGNLSAESIQSSNSVTVTSNQAIGPDGETSLSRVEITDTTNEGKGTFFSFSATTNATYCTSRFFRNDDQRYVSMRHYRSVDNWSAVVFDLQTGTVTNTYTGATSGTIVSYGIEEIKPGLFRCFIASNEAGSTLYPAIDFVSSGSPTLQTYGGQVYTGVAGVGLYVGFSQTELGAIPTSYIPTSGSTVTRAAETATIDAANLPYSATAMSIAMKGNMTYADTGSSTNDVRCYQWLKDSSNYLYTGLFTNGTNVGELTSLQNGAGVLDVSTEGGDGTFTPGVNVPLPFAVRHGSTVVQLATKGVSRTAENSPVALPDLSLSDMSLAPVLHGGIDLFTMFDDDIAEAGLIEGSTL